MTKKHLGRCPFCDQEGIPTVIEENSFRRDKCQCSNAECKGTIYICRGPGCHNYAKGGDVYDDEFCPSCTSGFTSTGKDMGALAGTLVVGALIAKVLKDGKGDLDQ